MTENVLVAQSKLSPTIALIHCKCSSFSLCHSMHVQQVPADPSTAQVWIWLFFIPFYRISLCFKRLQSFKQKQTEHAGYLTRLNNIIRDLPETGNC